LFREHISQLLRRLGYTVLEAASSATALPIAVATAKVDLLISDLHLDDGEGYLVAEEMRSRFSGLPIIFLSGTHGKTVPTNEVLLRKPVDEAQLGQAILEQLGRLPARHLTEKLLSRSRRLHDRLRHPSAVAFYRAWRNHCDVYKRLPSSNDLDDAQAFIEADGYIVEIAGARAVPTFRFSSASPDLERRLGRPLAGTYVTSADEDTLSSIGRALKRAMHGVAYFDYAEVTSEEGSARFERLMLPLSENGQDVTHLVGLVSFEDK
jgi:CheY-like chemotaxis protein